MANQEIAYENERSSAEAAENIYRKGFDRIRGNLKRKEYPILKIKKPRPKAVKTAVWAG